MVLSTTTNITGSLSAALVDGAISNSNGDIVNHTAATLAVTQTLHNGRTVTLNKASGVAVTLPAATGSGAIYRFVIGTTITSVGTTIKVPVGSTDSYLGFAWGTDGDGEGATSYGWNADAADDTVTLSGTATGGKAGDMFTFIDYATGLWQVNGFIRQSGGSEATPFSATV